jgi:septation ring formation regulator EzrA
LKTLESWATAFAIERNKFQTKIEAALSDVDRVLHELVRLPQSSAQTPASFAVTLNERVKLISECQKKQVDIANALETLRSSPSDLRSKVGFFLFLLKVL